MLIATLSAFVAANDQRNAKKLPDGIGVDARNLDTSHDDMRGLKDLSTVYTVTGVAGQIRSLYRWGRDTISDTAYWVASNALLDFARSMLAEDTTERTYISGGGIPRYFDSTTLGTAPYPTSTVQLGVPAPSSAMTLAAGTAGTGASETRVYIDTFVRANGDESAPGLPSEITVLGGTVVNGSSLAAAPGGTHGITLRRIYVFTTSGEFMRCKEQAAGLTTFIDTGARGAVLATGGSTARPAWLMPPDALFGLMEAWNGMLLGFIGKSYRACYPYKPHAWPLEYERIIPDTVVGAAKWGTSILLATTGLPRVVTGSTPLSLNDSPIYLNQAACVSKRSVKGVGHGVCWASNDGLCYHGQRGTGIITKSIIDKATWRALTPSGIVGAVYGQYYVGIYSGAAAFMIDTLDPTGVVWLDLGGFGVFEDTISGNLYLTGTGNTVRKFDAGSQLTAIFKSRVIRTKEKLCAHWARIEASNYPVSFKLWADGVLKADISVPGREPVTLPSGYQAELWQIQLSGAGPIEGVSVGTDVDELP